MKLNTLLLASAATLIASSAFAADLPSKKAAPAAGSVQVCKVGGMTGFTLPGSDTCFAISGRVTVDFQNGNLDDDYFGAHNGDVFGDGGVGYRLNFDARSNTEVGVVRSFISLTNGTATLLSEDALEDGKTDTTYARKAFIQVGGFTAGIKDSVADIAGTQGNLFGSGWSQASEGIDYQADVGGLHIGIEAGTPVSSTAGTDATPDLVAHLSGKAGGFGFALAAAMTNDGIDSGSAFMGSVNATAGSAKIFAWGGVSDGDSAGAYLTSLPVQEATTYGAGLTFTLSDKASVSVQGVRWDFDSSNLVGGTANGEQTDFGVYMSYALAKNLTIQPEVLVRDGDLSDATSALLRIQRDF